MTYREELLAAVDALETTLRRSAGLANAHFKDNRKEAIQTRRDVAERFAKIAAVGGAIDDAVWRDEFRKEFSKMRSAMALHHASWPVVSIDLDDPQYRASTQVTREANSRFIAWARATPVGREY